jgi:threonylcarbamoyladenosine tRNA methylthiotransferase MtaB
MNVYLDTIGCRLNQSEIERMARDFRTAGHTIVSEFSEADIVIVNTCAVTTKAASDSRQKIRHAGIASPNASIVATGCWATLEPQKAEGLTASTRVILNKNKDQLATTILGLKSDLLESDVLERDGLPGNRFRTRAFIKVQDGCDAFCTYCITRIARGPSRSVPLDIILKDIRSALDGGASEIVLSGVQLGGWGKDLQGKPDLFVLAEGILSKMDVPRLRFSSVEPWDLNKNFFDIFQDQRVCRHLHISLQSGCGSTLKRMGRKNSPAEYLQLLEYARSIDPDFAITTDIITGFPGETESEFQESLNFLCSAELSGGHVFPFSSRPGTPAADMDGQLPPGVRKNRAGIARKLLEDLAFKYRQRLVGQTGRILWETSKKTPGGFILQGLDEKFNRIKIPSSIDRWNFVDLVLYEGNSPEGLTGHILE